MTAAVPALLAEAAAWVGAIVVVVSGLTLLFTRKPFRWVGAKLVSEPFGAWVRSQIENSKTGKSVAHHLGPNGDTVPMHKRVAVLEVRALVDSWTDEIDDDKEGN